MKRLFIMLKMGCATRNVTPDFPVMLHGFGWRSHATELVEEPVEVGVIVLEQAGHHVLLITADMIGIYRNWCLKIKAELKARFGFAPEDIWLSASHSHYAPGFWGYTVACGNAGGEDLPYGFHPNDGRYYPFWMERLFQAVEEALHDLEEVSLECLETPVTGIAYSRRTERKDNGKVIYSGIYPKATQDNFNFYPIDERLLVWRFMVGDKPKAILGRYGCHTSTGGKEFYGISADYPWYFRQAIRREFSCPGFFMLGTAGDVVPMRRGGATSPARQDLGEILARSIKLNELRFRNADDFKLEVKTGKVRSHIARLDGYDRTMREVRWQKAVADTTPGVPSLPLTVEFYRYDISERYPDTNDPELPIHLMRLGSKVLVGLPFEVVSKVGLALSKACPEAVIVSVTNGYEGYLPMAEDFPKGGYEVERGAEFAPETGDNFLAEAIRLVKTF